MTTFGATLAPYRSRDRPYPHTYNMGVGTHRCDGGKLDSYGRLEYNTAMTDTVAPRTKAAVDWLTCTTKGKEATAELMTALLGAIAPIEHPFSSLDTWRFRGYVGHSLNGVRWGLRDDGGIVVLSGARASALWRVVSAKATNVSRIDTAVTVTLQEPDTGVSERAYVAARDECVAGSSFIQNSRGGTTLYIGARSSRFMGRLYDKGAEQGESPGLSWRYEVEVKKPASNDIVHTLLGSAWPAEMIASYVWHWFDTRNVRPLFIVPDVDSAIEISATVTSVERKLHWLSSQVRPTVSKLVDDGLLCEVLDHLGLRAEQILLVEKEGVS